MTDKKTQNRDIQEIKVRIERIATKIDEISRYFEDFKQTHSTVIILKTRFNESQKTIGKMTDEIKIIKENYYKLAIKIASWSTVIATTSSLIINKFW